jgi:hypothetical protein
MDDSNVFALTPEWARAFAHEWIEAWNSHDLERILAHYTDDFEMRSPLIQERGFAADGVLRGKDRLRAYWAGRLQATPPIQFELVDVFIGASSIAISYLNSERGPVTEVVTFNSVGKVVAGNALYAGRK